MSKPGYAPLEAESAPFESQSLSTGEAIPIAGTGTVPSKPTPYTEHNAPSAWHASYVEEDGTGAQPFDGERYIDEADEMIRLGFVRKVFGLLGVQLAVTSSIIAIFALVDPVTKYVAVDDKNGGHPWVFIVAMILSTLCILGLACFPHQARTYPNNYAFLGVFTVAESVLLGVISAAYTAESVLIAGSVTALLTLGLMVYAWKTKRDFTGAGPYLFMALWCLILYGIILGMFPALRSSVQTAYSLIGVVIFGFYIVYDVQLIIGGKHKRYRFSIDEHVFATLNIYLDIINLFIRLLQIFGDRR